MHTIIREAEVGTTPLSYFGVENEGVVSLLNRVPWGKWGKSVAPGVAQWFPSVDGLADARALLLSVGPLREQARSKTLRRRLGRLQMLQRLELELQELEARLRVAAEADVRFCMVIFRWPEDAARG